MSLHYPRIQHFLVTLLVLLVLVPGMVVLTHAQSLTPNIALQSNGCTATHSGGGAPPTRGPDLYNDGILDYCGGNLWGWTSTGTPPSTSDWIQFDWGTNAKTFDEISLYYVGGANDNNRYLSGGTVQYWNGATWVNHFNFTFVAPWTCVFV